MTETYKISFDEVKRGVSMEVVIGFLGFAGLKQKSARQWKGDCPFCKGIDCFAVTSDGGREKLGAFNCFKCPAGGDQIELVSLARGNARKDPKGVFAAAKELHAKFLGGHGTGGGAAEARDNSNASPQPKPERRAGFDPEAYAKTLDPGHEALAPFGIDAETFRAWRCGYASSGVNRGRLAMGIAGRDGALIGFAGRALKGESPKLIFPNGFLAQEHIFGADRVVNGPLILLRDPIDVLSASESGNDNVVCFLTDEVAAAQLERLSSLMDERHCESLTFF